MTAFEELKARLHGLEVTVGSLVAKSQSPAISNDIALASATRQVHEQLAEIFRIEQMNVALQDQVNSLTLLLREERAAHADALARLGRVKEAWDS